MKRTREQMKAELMKKVAAEFDRLLEWGEQTDKPNLTQIENEILARRKKVGEEMIEAILSVQTERDPHEAPACPGCGGMSQDKGLQIQQVETRIGTVSIQRRYYYCPEGRVGFFPPG